MPGEPHLNVELVSYWMLVPVDADGTPLHHGERMVEIEPGRWVDPLVAAALGLFAEKLAT